jgi:phosphoribosylamine---glycine ligase
MNVLVIGSGGREHALCWKLAASALLSHLYCAPGNPGIAQVATCVALDPLQFDTVIDFCRAHAIDLIVIGPEAPLVAGLADALNAAGLRCLGPSAYAAQLEGSKGFTKDICQRYAIPTAAYARFDKAADAKAYIHQKGAPIVVKYDGLAAGKGVVVAHTIQEADTAVQSLLTKSGDSLVIEEFLEGEEASFFVLSDGVNALPLATAQDHKRVGDGDTGPNTGGMGAYSPAPMMTEALVAQTMTKIIEPTLRALSDAGHPYVGVLYAGLMLTADGPKLIEYNCRFGDPECQALMMRLRSDVLPALVAACEGGLKHFDVRWRPEPALTVVMAARGYPSEPQKGTEIRGLSQPQTLTDDVEVFHSGTANIDGRLCAHGGRVLTVTALGPTLQDARDRAYEKVESIDWPEGFYRRDVGWRGIEAEKNALREDD